MKYLHKKYAVVAILIILLALTFFMAYINGIFTPLIERIFNETPQARIYDFVHAISTDNEKKASNLWIIPEWWNSDFKEFDDLKARKERVINELVNKKISPDFTIENIELWRTCCMPGIINDYKEAGGARIKVKLISENKTELYYTFDIFTRETTYFGDAAGYPVRNWVIRDIYADGDSPIFWTQSAN